MREILKAATVFTLLTLSVGITRAQVGLEECIESGMSNNPAIKSIELERQIDRSARRAAIGQFLPSVAVGFSLSRSSFYNPTYVNPDGSVATYPITQTDYSTYIDSSGYLRVDTSTIRQVNVPIPEGSRKASTSYLRIEETLFDGRQNYHNYKNAILSLETRDARIENTRRLVRNAIIQAFAAASAAERRMILAGKMTALRRLQLEYASARFQSGSVTKRDVLQVEVELGRAISDSLRAVLAIRRSFEELNTQIGLPLDSLFQLAEIEHPSLPVSPVDELEEISLSKRGDYIELMKSISQSDNDIKIQKGNYLPRLSAGLSHDRSERSGVEEAYTFNPRNKNTTIDLTLSWLIFDRFSRDLNLQQARIKRAKLEIEKENVRQEIYRQVRSAFETVQSANLQVEVAATNATLAEQTLEFEQERYRLGSATLIDLNASQLSYFQAQTEKIVLESEYLAALGNLESAVGQPLIGQ